MKQPRSEVGTIVKSRSAKQNRTKTEIKQTLTRESDVLKLVSTVFRQGSIARIIFQKQPDKRLDDKQTPSYKDIITHLERMSLQAESNTTPMQQEGEEEGEEELQQQHENNTRTTREQHVTKTTRKQHITKTTQHHLHHQQQQQQPLFQGHPQWQLPQWQLPQWQLPLGQ